MARLFNGTSDTAVSASALSINSFTKFALAFWLWWDTFAADDKYALNIFTGSVHVFKAIPDLSSPNAWYAEVDGNVGASGQTFTRPSAAAWHQYVINVDLTLTTLEVKEVYVDGTSQGLTSLFDANNASIVDGILYLMANSGAANFGAGRLAELAFYGGVNLTQQQVTDLQTMCPNFVGSPTYGWHLDGSASPEPNFVGGIDLNLTGTSQAAHPITCGGGAASPILASPVQSGLRW